MKYRSTDLIIISIDPDWNLSGVRVHSRAHSLHIREKIFLPGSKSASSGGLAENLQKAAAALHRTRNSILFLTGHMPSCVFFESDVPKMSAREVKDCLLLEVDSKMPQVPLGVSLNWQAEPADDEEKLHIRACAWDGEELTVPGKALEMLRWKVDGFIPALLALPGDKTAVFREFGGGFARRNNSWQIVSAAEKEKLAQETRETVSALAGNEISETDAFEYGACIAAAAAILRQTPKGTMTDYSIFNGALRPRRLRSHIIYTCIMLALLAAAGVSALWGSLAKDAGEYRRVSSRIESLDQEILRLKRKIKTSEKEDKDNQKILETFHGENMILQRMTRISSVIPGDVLLSDLKINENTWDMTCLTENTEVDMASTVRRIPGFKLKSIEQRPNRQNLTSFSIRLEVVDRSAGRK